MFIIIFNFDSTEFSTTKLFKTWSNSYTIALNIVKPACLMHPYSSKAFQQYQEYNTGPHGLGDLNKN
jgi:hypothetical protein